VPVDADLVLKDDEGWYPQLRLHYFLTVGREFLKMRGQRVQTQKEKGSSVDARSKQRPDERIRRRIPESGHSGTVKPCAGVQSLG